MNASWGGRVLTNDPMLGITGGRHADAGYGLAPPEQCAVEQGVKIPMA